MVVKRDGKDAEWQAKLKEAMEPFDQVLDEWNEITASLPTSPQCSSSTWPGAVKTRAFTGQPIPPACSPGYRWTGSGDRAGRGHGRPRRRYCRAR